MGLHILAGGRHERRIEPIINGIGNRLHRGTAGRKSFDHLPLAHPAMVQVSVKNRPRIFDRVAVRRQEASGAELQHTLERRHVLTQITAAARVDHHAAAADDEIPGKYRPPHWIPEDNVIRRMTGCVHDSQHPLTHLDLVAVSDRIPGHVGGPVHSGPTEFLEPNAWMSLA